MRSRSGWAGVAALLAAGSLLLSPAESLAAPCTITWDGSAGNASWADPANWSTNTVPGAGDHVCVPDLVSGIEVVHSLGTTSILSLQATGGVRLAGGTLELTSTPDLSTAAELEIAAGAALGGAGTLELSGSLLWSGGSMTGSGITRVLPTATVTQLTTTGTNLANGRVLEVAGTLDMASDHVLFTVGTPNPLVRVLSGGVVRRSSTTGEARIDVPLENHGQVRADSSGTLRLNGGGGAVPATGVFGATGQPGGVVFSNGTFPLGSGARLGGGVTVGPLATVNASGGTVTVTGGNTLSGIVGGTGTVEVTGPVLWSGGRMTGAGVTRVLPGATLTHATTTGTGLENGRVLEVAGLLHMTADHAIFTAGPTAPALRVVPGGVVRGETVTSAGVARIDVPVENDGLIESARGTVRLAGGGAGLSSGQYGAAGQAGSVELGGGTVDLGAARFAGGVTLGSLATATVAGGSTLTVAGTNTLSGVLGGTGTVEVTGSVLWSGGTMTDAGVTRVLPGATLTHATTTGTRLVNGRVLEIAGVLAMTVDHAIFSTGPQTPRLHVLAGGVLRGATATGVARIDVPVLNDGLVEAVTGTLQLVAFTNPGSVAVVPGAAITLTGSFANFSGTTLTGGEYSVAGSLRFSGADIVTNAASITLSGPAAQIADLSATPLDALRNFASNAAVGLLRIREGRTVVAPGPVSNAGTLVVEDGSAFQSGPLTNTGRLSGTGTLKANVTNGGEVAPGLSPGILTVDGDYAQTSAGTLRIELAGTTPGTGYDRLVVTGTAALAGTLAVETAPGFAPASDMTFDVLTSASRTGEFGAVTGGYAARYAATGVAIGPGGAQQPPPPPPPPPPPLPPPVFAKSVNVEPVARCRVPGVRECRVLVKVPGGRFVVLERAEQIPVGSELDTTVGEVRLETARSAQGGTQVANFYAGRFRVRQRRARRPVAEMVLRGGSPCRARASAAKRRRGRARRKLWGDGKGSFATRGKFASGGVRGTRWLVEDRCDGTLVRVAQGRVEVRDFVRRRTVILRAGQSYLARP